MSDSNINIKITAADKATATVKDVSKSLRDLGESAEKSSRKASKMSSALRSMGAGGGGIFDRMASTANGAFASIGNSVRNVGRLINTMWRGAMVAGTAVFQGFVKVGLAYNGQIDTYRTTMTTYLGDAKQAAGLIMDAQRFAMKTPLDTSGVIGSMNMLIQYGATAKEASKMTKQLADVSGGSSEKMTLLGIAMSQVAAKGRLQGEEVRQLTNAGYNPLKTIAEQTGKSMKDVMADMKKGEVSFDMVRKALDKDTGAMGKFHNNAAALSKTLPGATSNIKEMYTAISGKALESSYLGLRKVAVQTQSVVGVFADGVISGKGFRESFDAMIAKTKRMNGWMRTLGGTLEDLGNSKAVNFGIKFKAGVSDTLADNTKELATYNRKVRALAIKNAGDSGRGPKQVTKVDTMQARQQLDKLGVYKPKMIGIGEAIKTEMGKSKGGSGVLKVFSFIGDAIKRIMPIVKVVMGLVGKGLEALQPRLAKLGEAFMAMKPIWTNVLAPLFTGVFKGVLSVIDPIVSIIAWLAPWIGKLGTLAAPLKPVFEGIGYAIGMFAGGPIVAAIGKFTKGFGLIGKSIGPAGKFITKFGGLFTKVFTKLIMFPFKLAVAFAKFYLKAAGFVAKLYLKFGQMILGVLGKFGSMVGGVLVFVGKILLFPAKMYLSFVGFIAKMAGKFGTMVGVMAIKIGGWITSTGSKFGNLVRGFVSKMLNGITSIGEKIGGIGKKFGESIGQGVISLINAGIDRINDALGRIENAANRIPGANINIPTIPKLGGGGSFSSGSAIVGERGAELLTLTARGATITPAQHLTERRGATAGSIRSALAASGDGRPLEIVVHSPVVIDGREVARASARHTINRMARA